MPTSAKPTVLVLGATGFLGGHVARAFDQRGYPVRGTKRASSPTWHVEDVDIEWAEVDLDADDAADRLDDAMADAQFVVDCAAHYAADVHDIDRAKRIGVGRLRRVMDACKRQNIARYVYVSSPATLGYTDGEPDETLDEADFYTPGSLNDAYYESKWSMEAEIYRYLLEGLSSIILIPGAVFGPGDIKPATGEFIVRLANGQVPALIGNRFNAVDARDVANTAVNAINRARPGRRYVLGGHNLDVGDFASSVADAAGVKPPTRRLPGNAVRRVASIIEKIGRGLGLVDGPMTVGLDMILYARALDIERAEGELDHQPRPIDETISDSLKWFRRNDYL